jgi:HAD superfamily hydrolase (TIGR01509 family)
MQGRLLIYDCDGTLIDSETIAGAVCAEAARSLGLAYTTEAYNLKFTGVPGHITWKMLAEELGRPLPEGLNDRVDAEIRRRFEDELEVIAGVREAVAAIGGARCVASSTELQHLRKNLVATGLMDLFDPAVFSASQVRRGKPAPDVFLFAASQMGFDPQECLVVEDSVNGVTAARRAGMRVIGFVGAGHATDALPARLMAAGALTIVKHMDDLPEVVAGL